MLRFDKFKKRRFVLDVFEFCASAWWELIQNTSDNEKFPESLFLWQQVAQEMPATSKEHVSNHV